MEYHLGCPEKRLAHKSIYSEDKISNSAHNAFYNGLHLPTAGLMPTEIENTIPIKINEGSEQEEQLKLIHEITAETRFVMSVTEPDGTVRKVPGKPIEDCDIIPFSKAALKMEHLNILALHSSISEARKELVAFVRHKVSHTAEGKSLDSPLGRISRPCFALWPDTGGDSLMTRGSFSTTTKIISPVNEVYNIMVAATLFHESHDLEIAGLMIPFSLTVDGESNANTANVMLSNLRSKDVVEGVVYSYPVHIVQEVLTRVFGIDGTGALLSSHANFKALKLLWNSAVLYSLDLRRVPLSMADYFEHLQPLRDIGTMPRDDVPVISSETIVLGSREGSSKEAAYLLNPYKAFDYFCGINKLNYEEAANLNYEDLRRYLEKTHLVIGENQLPSYSEYEMMKMLLLDHNTFGLAALKEARSKYLIPHTPERVPLEKCETLDQAYHFLHSDKRDVVNVLRKSLARKFVMDMMHEKEGVSGIFRLNAAYIRAYFQGDFPLVYAELLENKESTDRLCEDVYKTFSQTLVELLEEIQKQSTDELFLLSIANKVNKGQVLSTPLEKEAAAILRVLRINSKLNKYVLENANAMNKTLVWPINFQIAEVQRKIIQGYINQVMNDFLPGNSFAIQHLDDKNVLTVAASFQAYIATVGTHSGEYEKLIKSIANLVLYSLATNKLDVFYTSLNILYFIAPERVSKKPITEPFKKVAEGNLQAFKKVRDTLYSLRKREGGFVELLNGMLMNGLFLFRDLNGKYQKDRYYNLIEGLFAVTSNFNQHQLFQKPFTSFSFFNSRLQKAITNSLNSRIRENQRRISELLNLKNKIEVEQQKNLKELFRDNNYAMTANIIGNDPALLREFERMLREGLLAGKSTTAQIDELIANLQEKHERWSKNYAILISKMNVTKLNSLIAVAA